ncbi:IS66 family insertion sequence element accessory protein TnpB [Megasphaera sp.]|uniref:IS66 family insertion sequence element accessory protein TnpB n=1 Tax=Megasphaera sp. TaxID=2023260 RepID=UPI003520E6FF
MLFSKEDVFEYSKNYTRNQRFEKGRLQWPRTPDEVRELTPQQYRWLMEGLSVEQPRAVQKITPKMVL